MILKRDFADRPDRRVIAEHIEETIGDALHTAPGGPAPLVVREVARGVAAYLDVAQAGGIAIQSGSLYGLASRALDAVGEPGAARRLLLFGGGMARASAWTVTGGRTMVVLDLARFLPRQGYPLELAFYGTLDATLCVIAELWDEGSGEGALGLRNLRAPARAFTGARAPRRHAEAFMREVALRCAGKLDQLRQARGWRAAPLIMHLDPVE